jgi:hypothetical protein
MASKDVGELVYNTFGLVQEVVTKLISIFA